MNYLVDTQALLLWESESERLGPLAGSVFEDPANVLYVSHASVWEMSIKIRLGKLTLPAPLGVWVRESVANGGFVLLPIELDAILGTQGLPLHHGDPFDRLLISTALVHDWPAVSSDERWDDYAVRRIW